jgi:predicted transcriptional regulator
VELAASVWMRLKKGASINDLHRDVPRSSYAIYRTLLAMVDAGMAG